MTQTFFSGQQRQLMVQTESQYNLLHEIVFMIFSGQFTDLPENVIDNVITCLERGKDDEYIPEEIHNSHSRRSRSYRGPRKTSMSSSGKGSRRKASKRNSRRSRDMDLFVGWAHFMDKIFNRATNKS